MNHGVIEHAGTSGTASLALEPLPLVVTRQPVGCRHGFGPKPKAARYESLTIWRGVACLMLLIYHSAFYADHTFRIRDRSTWTLGGICISGIDRLSMGVPIFFVVSGYCIAASIDSLRRREHSLREYFWRRFRRIYPPLWAAYALVVAFTLVAILAGPVYDQCKQLPRFSLLGAGEWFGNITASESWMPHLRGDHAASYLLPNTWTLCYEEQFYVVTGILLAFAAKRFFPAAYMVAAATLIVRYIAAVAGINITGFFFDGLWVMFSIGILVYERLNYFGQRGGRVVLGILSLGFIYGGAMRVLSAGHEERHFGERMLAACAFGVLLIYLKRWDLRIAQARVLKPLAWYGKMSYSVFLTHYPIVVLAASWLASVGIHSDGLVALVTVPLCIAVSMPIAWLFYLGVEQHFLNTPMPAARPQLAATDL
jgi:peptidoglycan/LPS O-acetylase OafA/YrhL